MTSVNKSTNILPKAGVSTYEIKICALLALRFYNPSLKIKNFKISQFVTTENTGIVLKLENDSEELSTFYIQLKHFSENERKKTLKYTTFHEKKTLISKAPFNLQTFYKCITEKINELPEEVPETVKYVLFTNKDREENEKKFASCTNKNVDLINVDGTAFCFKKFKIPSDNKETTAANTAAVNGDVENNVENEIDRNFLKKLYILCKQPNEEDLSNLIKYSVQSIFKLEPSKAEDIVTKYIEHITNWMKGFCGERPLSREVVKFKLGEFVLNPYLYNYQPNFKKLPTHALIPWIKWIKNYRFVIVENCKTAEIYEDCITYVFYNIHLVLKNYINVIEWVTEFTLKELDYLYAHKRRNKQLKEELHEFWGKATDIQINMQKLCLYFWNKGVIPLVVRIRREDDLKNLLNISNFTSGRFVVFYQENFTILPQIIEAYGNGNRGSIMSKLFNLQQSDKDFILNQPITFQGRNIKVRDVLSDDRMKYQIFTVDLVQILLKKFNVGRQDFVDPFPGCPQFIPRTLSNTIVKPDIFKARVVHIIFCRSKEIFVEFSQRNNMRIEDNHTCVLEKFKSIPPTLDTTGTKLSGSVPQPSEEDLLEFPRDRTIYINIDYEIEEINNGISENRRDGEEYILYDLGDIYGNLDLAACDPNYVQTVNVIICKDTAHFDTFAQHNKITVYTFEIARSDFSKIDLKSLAVTLRYLLVTEEDDLTALRHYRSSKLSFHIYKLHTTEDNFVLELVGFFGESSEVCKFKDNNFECEEIKFDILNCFKVNHLNLITGSPGMGKSVLVNKLLQICPVNYLSIYINFNLQSNYFIDKDVSDEDTVYHLKYFLNFDVLNTFEQNYIDVYLQNQNVCIFFDGYDEIPPELEGIITKFLQDLLNDNFILFITTRPSKAEYLETKLKVLSRSLTPFSDKNISDYLTNYYKTKISNKGVDRIPKFVSKLLPVTKKKMTQWDSDFAAVPLQTYMISEIYLDDCRKFCSNTEQKFHSVGFSDVLDLYDRFMESKCIRYSQRPEKEQRQTGEVRDNNSEEEKSEKVEKQATVQFEENGHDELDEEFEEANSECSEDDEDSDSQSDDGFEEDESDVNNDHECEINQPTEVNHIFEDNACEELEETNKNPQGTESTDLLKNKRRRKRKRRVLTVQEQKSEDMSTKNNLTNPLLNYKLCAFKSLFFADNSEVNLTGFIEDIVKRKDKFGLIDTFLDEDTPVFVHRTFAEFLIATYITENVQKPFVKFLLSIMLGNPVYDLIRQLVDRMLAKECPLHRALLSGDEEVFEKLLKNESELMKLDLGGRNILHLGMSWGARHDVPETALLEVIGDETDWDGFRDKMLKIYQDSKTDAKRESFVAMILKNTTELLFKLDDILHVSPLDYGVKVMALENINLYLENLCKVDGYYWIVETNIKALCKYDKEVESAFSFDHKQLMFVCAMFDYSNIALALVHLKPSSCDIRGMTFGANLISLMHFAAWFGADKVIDLLSIIVNIPIDVLEKGDGHSPLHWASGRGNISTVNLLLEMQANWKLLDVNGLNPLYFALKNRQSEVVSVLTEWDNKSRLVKPKITKFFGASVSCDLHEAKLWLSSGENPNEATDKGWRPLMLAAIKGHIGMVKLLLDFGADVNATHANNYTALMWAAYKGHVEVVRLLVEAKADVNFGSDCGSTALSLAIKGNHTQVVALLREAGAIK